MHSCLMLQQVVYCNIQKYWTSEINIPKITFFFWKEGLFSCAFGKAGKNILIVTRLFVYYIRARLHCSH
jgi:hypothetical protein